jgi:hypothetical protein
MSIEILEDSHQMSIVTHRLMFSFRERNHNSLYYRSIERLGCEARKAP